MNALLTLAVVASLVFAWISFFHVIPSCLMSIFRQRLWTQRDELAAEIRAGEFQNSEPAEVMIEFYERFIRLAPEFSFVRVFTAVLVGTLSNVPAAPKPFSVESLQPSERQLLEKYVERFNETLADHILFETPSGWFVVALSLLLAPILIPLQKIRERPAPVEQLRGRATDAAKEFARRNRFTPELNGPRHAW